MSLSYDVVIVWLYKNIQNADRETFLNVFFNTKYAASPTRFERPNVLMNQLKDKKCEYAIGVDADSGPTEQTLDMYFI